MSTRTLTDHAVEEWYRRCSPLDPRSRAAVIAAEYELDAHELFDACQVDFAKHDEAA